MPRLSLCRTHAALRPDQGARRTSAPLLVASLLVASLLAASACQAGPAGDPTAGRAAFEVCASCHQVGPSARAGFGPPLNGLFGRKAGAVPGYRYSQAMKASTIVWTEQRLADFIRDPQATVPGTTMRFYSFGFGDRKIADLLAYLRTYQAINTARP